MLLCAHQDVGGLCCGQRPKASRNPSLFCGAISAAPAARNQSVLSHGILRSDDIPLTEEAGLCPGFAHKTQPWEDVHGTLGNTHVLTAGCRICGGGSGIRSRRLGPLFDGKNLDQWEGDGTATFKIEDGSVVAVDKKDPGRRSPPISFSKSPSRTSSSGREPPWVS